MAVAPQSGDSPAALVVVIPSIPDPRKHRELFALVALRCFLPPSKTTTGRKGDYSEQLTDALEENVRQNIGPSTVVGQLASLKNLMVRSQLSMAITAQHNALARGEKPTEVVELNWLELIPDDELVACDVPFRAELPYMCAVCGRTDGKLAACSGCATLIYCGRECQKTHWSFIHKKQCKKRKENVAAGMPAGGVPTARPFATPPEVEASTPAKGAASSAKTGQVHEEWQVCKQLGLDWAKEGKWEAAVIQFEKAMNSLAHVEVLAQDIHQRVEVQHESSRLLSNAAMCHLKLGEKQLALRCAVEAVWLNTEWCKAWARMGQCYEAMGRQLDAFDSYNDSARYCLERKEKESYKKLQSAIQLVSVRQTTELMFLCLTRLSQTPMGNPGWQLRLKPFNTPVFEQKIIEFRRRLKRRKKLRANHLLAYLGFGGPTNEHATFMQYSATDDAPHWNRIFLYLDNADTARLACVSTDYVMAVLYRFIGFVSRWIQRRALLYSPTAGLRPLRAVDLTGLSNSAKKKAKKAQQALLKTAEAREFSPEQLAEKQTLEDLSRWMEEYMVGGYNASVLMLVAKAMAQLLRSLYTTYHRQLHTGKKKKNKKQQQQELKESKLPSLDPDWQVDLVDGTAAIASLLRFHGHAFLDCFTSLLCTGHHVPLHILHSPTATVADRQGELSAEKGINWAAVAAVLEDGTQSARRVAQVEALVGSHIAQPLSARAIPPKEKESGASKNKNKKKNKKKNKASDSNLSPEDMQAIRRWNCDGLWSFFAHEVDLCLMQIVSGQRWVGRPAKANSLAETLCAVAFAQSGDHQSAREAALSVLHDILFTTGSLLTSAEIDYLAMHVPKPSPPMSSTETILNQALSRDSLRPSDPFCRSSSLVRWAKETVVHCGTQLLRVAIMSDEQPTMEVARCWLRLLERMRPFLYTQVPEIPALTFYCLHRIAYSFRTTKLSSDVRYRGPGGPARRLRALLDDSKGESVYKFLSTLCLMKALLCVSVQRDRDGQYYGPLRCVDGLMFELAYACVEATDMSAPCPTVEKLLYTPVRREMHLMCVSMGQVEAFQTAASTLAKAQ